MFRPRIIPVLLLKNKALVKSIKFKNFRYIGDPINAVKLFNDFKADELVFLDIEATKEKRLISLDFVKNVGEEANMPFSVGGGIRKIEDIRKIINSGAERVIIGNYAVEEPNFIRESSKEFGSSTICVCIDVRKNIFGKEKVYSNSGKHSSKLNPVDFALIMEEKGAGEIIIQSIERDGMMNGYNIELIKSISEKVCIPVVALGGASNIDDLRAAYTVGFANGLAAGSLFVYKSQNKGVLINYPEPADIERIFKD